MRILFVSLLVLSTVCLATWVNPYYLGSPPNGIFENRDPEYGLSVIDLYFSRDTGPTLTIVLTHRTASSWTEPMEIPALNPFNRSWSPALTGNGTRMYFCTYDNDHEENDDIYYSQKVGGVWQTAVKLGSRINSSYDEDSVAISPDGSTLYFSSNRDGGGNNNFDIYQSYWMGGAWSPAVKVTSLNSPLNDRVCDISSDDTKLYISRSIYSFMEGGYDYDLFVSTWNGTWGTPTPLTFVNTAAYNEGGATISPGNDRLAFWSNRPNGTNDYVFPGLWETFINNLDVEPASVGLIKAVYK